MLISSTHSAVPRPVLRAFLSRLINWTRQTSHRRSPLMRRWLTSFKRAACRRPQAYEVVAGACPPISTLLAPHIPIRLAQRPNTKDKLESRIINRAILVEYPFRIFLLPPSVRFLTRHDQSTCTSDRLDIGIPTVYERQDGPGCHDDLRGGMLVVFEVNAGLVDQPVSTEVRHCTKSEKSDTHMVKRTRYVSPQPPSSFCLPIKKSHARLTLSELAYVSPAICSDSSANIVA